MASGNTVTATGTRNVLLVDPVLLLGHIKEKEAGLTEFGFLTIIVKSGHHLF